MPEPTREQEHAIGGLASNYPHVQVEHLPPMGAQLLLVRCYDHAWKQETAVFIYADGHARKPEPVELAERGLESVYRPTPEERGAA